MAAAAAAGRKSTRYISTTNDCVHTLGWLGRRWIGRLTGAIAVHSPCGVVCSVNNPIDFSTLFSPATIRDLFLPVSLSC